MTLPDANPWDDDLILDRDDLERISDGTWRIEDDAKANWALRKLDQKQREIDRIEANVRREIDRINALKDAAVKTLKDDLSFFAMHLTGYRRRLEQDNKDLPQTYKLPSGVITRRKGQSRMEVTDEQAFIEWAEANDPDLYKRSPLVSGLTRKGAGYSAVPGPGDVTVLVARSGEVVPGVHRVSDPDVYSAKPT